MPITNCRIKRWGIITLVVLFSFTSCIKDTIDLDKISTDFVWKPKLGIPVSYGTITLKDILLEVDSLINISEDEDGLLRLIYHDNIISNLASEKIVIPVQQNFELFVKADPDFPGFPPGGEITVQRTKKHQFQFGDKGEEIDSVLLKAGVFRLTLSSEFLHTGQFTITIPGATKNGQVFKRVIPINKSDGTFSFSEDISAENYWVRLENNDTEVNKLTIELELKLTDSGSPVNDEQLSMTVDFIGLEFKELHGYLGQYDVMDGQGKIALSLFDNDLDAEAEFKESKLRVISKNSFGVPTQVNLHDVVANSRKNSKILALVFNSSVNPFILDYPSQVGKTAKGTKQFDETNTNMAEVISIAPNELMYGISARTNPGGKTAVKNFVTDQSRLDVDIEVEIPMYVKAKYYQYEMNLEMDLTEQVESIDMVEELTLQLAFNNGMPFDVEMQIYMADSNNVYIDSLLTDKKKVIRSGTVSQTTGKVTTPTEEITRFVLNKDKLESAKKMKSLVLLGSFITAENGSQFVKFYSDYKLEVRVGFQVEARVDSNTLDD